MVNTQKLFSDKKKKIILSASIFENDVVRMSLQL